jgi:hypothetical protein
LSEGGQLQSRKSTSVFAVLIILYSGIVPPSLDTSKTCTPTIFIGSYDGMIIESDSDFEARGWSGNGSAVDPYLLSHEEFEGEYYIQIRNTRSHFRIENCIINIDYHAVHFYNVTNGVIFNNSIVPKSLGIGLTSCDSVKIVENSVHGGYEWCLFITSSTNIMVLDNSFASVRQAVWLYETTNTTLIGNELATVEEGYTAVDDRGVNNSWDDGISLGNAWYNYNGSGKYNIPGSTNSTDHFPTIFDPSFPIDFEGPTILAPGGTLYVDYMYEFLSHWRFEAIEVILLELRWSRLMLMMQFTK